MDNMCSRKCNCWMRCLSKRSQVVLWMWCIVINLPCIRASCCGVNISVALYPEGLITLRYGEPLEIFCVAENNFTADDLGFFSNQGHDFGKKLDSEIVNRTTRRLYIEHLEKNLYMYYCRNNVTNKQCVGKVLVDSPPSDITDFSCISKNIEVLICTWTSKENLSKINHILTFLFNNKRSLPCEIKRNGEEYLFSMNTTSRPRYKQMQEQFTFHLQSCNVFGCNNQTFTINHFSRVKPDPPGNLRVVSHEPHSVLLSWYIPNNIVDFLIYPIVHRIEYRIAKIDRTDYFHSVDTSILKSNASSNKSNPNKRSYTFLLSNLPYAHMSYEVRIYIKPENATEDRFWSDFAYVLFTTGSAKPQRPPDTIVGAFDQSVHNDKRLIHIYWKPLEGYEEAGAIFTYKVVILQASKNPQIVLSDNNKSFVTIDEVSLEDVDVSIWSVNEVGSSVNSSHIYIPSKRDTDALQVHSFTKVSYDNGTYKLSWLEVEHVDNYTLFWCKYYYATDSCSGPISVINLEPKRNSYISILPDENRYQFAIQANRGNNTSGMIWAKFAS